MEMGVTDARPSHDARWQRLGSAFAVVASQVLAPATFGGTDVSYVDVQPYLLEAVSQVDRSGYRCAAIWKGSIQSTPQEKL